jgi:hypothetical protein
MEIETKREILANALAELEIAGEHPRPWSPDQGLFESGIRYQPATWLERRLDHSERAQFSRTLRRLEREGLLCRVLHPVANRTARIQITPAGLAEAESLTGYTANHAHILNALKATKWWPQMARATRKGRP